MRTPILHIMQGQTDWSNNDNPAQTMSNQNSHTQKQATMQQNQQSTTLKALTQTECHKNMHTHPTQTLPAQFPALQTLIYLHQLTKNNNQNKQNALTNPKISFTHELTGQSKLTKLLSKITTLKPHQGQKNPFTQQNAGPKTPIS